MAYDIRKTDGTVFVTVEDGTLDNTTTSIQFVGKRYPEYGLILNENDLHQLENFANPTPPLNPVIGQMWFDNTPSIEGIKVYTGGVTGWRGLGFSNNFSDSTIRDNLTFLGTARFTNDVIFDGIVELGSEQVMTFAGTSLFNGAVTFSSTPAFNSGMTIIGTTTASAITSSGNITAVGSVLSNIAFHVNEYGAGLSPTTITGTLAMYGAEIDGLDNRTVLYLNFAGVDGATTVTDLSPGTQLNGGTGPNNSIAFNGTAAIDIYRTRLANGSLLLDGGSDFLTITDNINYDFGIAPFVMDGWIYTVAASTAQVIFAKGTATSDRWEIFINSSDALAFEYSDGSDTISISGGNIPTFRWIHWAIERETDTTNSIFTLYLDGNRVATATVVLADYNFDDITGNVFIGQRSYGTFEYFDGNMDEIRVETEAKYFGGFRPRQITNDNNDGLFYKNSAGLEFRTTFETNNW